MLICMATRSFYKNGNSAKSKVKCMIWDSDDFSIEFTTLGNVVAAIDSGISFENVTRGGSSIAIGDPSYYIKSPFLSVGNNLLWDRRNSRYQVFLYGSTLLKFEYERGILSVNDYAVDDYSSAYYNYHPPVVIGVDKYGKIWIYAGVIIQVDVEDGTISKVRSGRGSSGRSVIGEGLLRRGRIPMVYGDIASYRRSQLMNTTYHTRLADDTAKADAAMFRSMWS